jgi:hypothetical protein
MAVNRSKIVAGLGRERAAALTCDGQAPLWRVTPNQRLIADGIKAQQKVALFLGKSGKLCYTINHSPGRTRALAGAERGENKCRRNGLQAARAQPEMAAGIFLV